MTTYRATHSDSSVGIDEAVIAGIEWIQGFSEGLVIAPTLNHFRDYPLRAHSQLKTITDQYNKTSYTKFWSSYTGKSNIILACWPKEEELDKLDCLDGLQDPLFCSIVISVFQILKVGGYEWEPHIIKAWAMTNNWTTPNAQQLREIAKGVQDGRIDKALLDDWPKDILQEWEKPD